MSTPAKAIAAPAAQTAASLDQKVEQIPIDLIDPCPVNPRKNIDQAQLAELAVSIGKMGITNPVTVRPGWTPEGKPQRYELIAGHRRTEAARLAGLAEVPAIVRRLTDREALDHAVVDNLQRVDLSAMEEADGYRLLVRVMGMEKASAPVSAEDYAGEIALKVGKTLRYVVQRLKLLSLIEEAQDVMRQGLLSIDAALLIARLKPADQGDALLYAIDHRKASKGKTLRERVTSAVTNLKSEQAHWCRQSTIDELKEWIAGHITLSLKGAPWALEDAGLLPAAGPCTTCPRRVGNDTALFGDLTSNEDTCTDPRCYEAKQKAFVKLTLKEAAESGAPVLKLSTSRSLLPIKEGSVLDKTTFKCGQWVEAKKGSCPDTHRGVTEEGEFKTVCVNQKCAKHKHRVQQPAARGERVDRAEQERIEKERERTEKLFKEHETVIRATIFRAVLAKLDAADAVRLVAHNTWNHAAARKELLKAFPTLDGMRLEALVLFCHAFDRDVRANTYLMVAKKDGVAEGRKNLWALAKATGVNADAIAAKHFHDQGSIAPAADPLYPKGVPWPKESSSKSSPKASARKPTTKKPTSSPARKKAAKKAAKKGGAR